VVDITSMIEESILDNDDYLNLRLSPIVDEETLNRSMDNEGVFARLVCIIVTTTVIKALSRCLRRYQC